MIRRILKWLIVSLFLLFFVIFCLKEVCQVLHVWTILNFLGNTSQIFAVYSLPARIVFAIVYYALLISGTGLLLLIIALQRKKKNHFVGRLIGIECVVFVLFVVFNAWIDPRSNPWLHIRQPVINTDISNIAKQPILISTDNATTARLFSFIAPEQDDGLALAVLLQAEKAGQLSILGITSTFGNIDGETAYRVTLKQVALSGLPIPVVKGASYAGQKNSQAVEYIAKTLRNSDQRVTLVALGPVTDFAAVFSKYPELKQKVGDFLVVRSGPYLNQDRWFLYSFNALQDYNAAIALYEMGANQIAMGTEVFKVGLSDGTIAAISSIRTPMTQFIGKDLPLWNQENKMVRGADMCPWDLVWVMYLTDPGLFSVQLSNDHLVLHLQDREVLVRTVLERLSI